MKTVLFVDDEPHVLSALQRSLRTERHRWHVSFAEGGEAALAFLASETADVIVSDIRMPHMDGVDLLERVRDLYPTMVRLVLSGQAEAAIYDRAVAVAHQLLEKPCDGGTLRAAIERALEDAGWR